MSTASWLELVVKRTNLSIGCRLNKYSPWIRRSEKIWPIMRSGAKTGVKTIFLDWLISWVSIPLRKCSKITFFTVSVWQFMSLGKDISCLAPEDYFKRFQNFIYKYIFAAWIIIFAKISIFNWNDNKITLHSFILLLYFQLFKND